MKATVHAEDGYSTELDIEDSTTSQQVLQRFCEKRFQASYVTAAMRVMKLVYESDAFTGARVFPRDVKVNSRLRTLKSHQEGRLVAIGCKSAVHLKERVQMQDSDPTTSRRHVGARVHAITKAFRSKVNELLGEALLQDSFNKASLLAARGNLLTSMLCCAAATLHITSIFL
jgi:hypothetical protein